MCVLALSVVDVSMWSFHNVCILLAQSVDNKYCDYSRIEGITWFPVVQLLEIIILPINPITTLTLITTKRRNTSTNMHEHLIHSMQLICMNGISLLLLSCGDSQMSQ